MNDPVKDGKVRPLSLERRLLRLRHMDRLCRNILSQVPGAEGHGVDALPASLADKIAECDCATLYNITRVCLLRLVGEAIVPAPSRGRTDSTDSDLHGG